MAGRTFRIRKLSLPVIRNICIGIIFGLVSGAWFDYAEDRDAETDYVLYDDYVEFGAEKQNGSQHTGIEVKNRSVESQVRILCWILTDPKAHRSKSIHVKRTWGRRCNILLFMSTKNDSMLGSVPLDVSEGRRYLFDKTKAAFQYVYDNYGDEADWFLKADDDTYVIMENLREFLKTQSSLQPIYFGCRFRPIVMQGFMSGGAGYVLSKSALNSFVVKGMKQAIPECTLSKDAGAEDVGMGRCLEAVGVVAGDSRDMAGSHRFLPFDIDEHMDTDVIKAEHAWYPYPKYSFYPQNDGLNCCSMSAVSFHYISPGMMYSMDYLLYRHRVIQVLE